MCILPPEGPHFGRDFILELSLSYGWPACPPPSIEVTGAELDSLTVQRSLSVCQKVSPLISSRRYTDKYHDFGSKKKN